MELLVVSNRRIENARYFANQDALIDYLKYSGEKTDAILFAFWSEKVPTWMLLRYKCYGMHTGYLTEGKGKGGSPIDNLKRLGVNWAQLNVFEMNEEFDNGKVILAIPWNMQYDKDMIIEIIDTYIPDIQEYLEEDHSMVPERFKRI